MFSQEIMPNPPISVSRPSAGRWSTPPADAPWRPVRGDHLRRRQPPHRAPQARRLVRARGSRAGIAGGGTAPTGGGVSASGEVAQPAADAVLLLGGGAAGGGAALAGQEPDSPRGGLRLRWWRGVLKRVSGSLGSWHCAASLRWMIAGAHDTPVCREVHCRRPRPDDGPARRAGPWRCPTAGCPRNRIGARRRTGRWRSAGSGRLPAAT
jgi:hypothetical protein